MSSMVLLYVLFLGIMFNISVSLKTASLTGGDQKSDLVVLPSFDGGNSDLIENEKPYKLNFDEPNNDKKMLWELKAVNTLNVEVKHVLASFEGEASEACQRNTNGIGWKLYDLWHNSKALYADHTLVENQMNVAAASVDMINAVAVALSNCQSALGSCSTIGYMFITLLTVTLTDLVAKILTLLAGRGEEISVCEKGEEYTLTTQNAQAISAVYDLVPTIFDLRDILATIQPLKLLRRRKPVDAEKAAVDERIQTFENYARLPSPEPEGDDLISVRHTWKTSLKDRDDYLFQGQFRIVDDKLILQNGKTQQRDSVDATTEASIAKEKAYYAVAIHDNTEGEKHKNDPIPDQAEGAENDKTPIPDQAPQPSTQPSRGDRAPNFLSRVWRLIRNDVADESVTESIELWKLRRKLVNRFRYFETVMGIIADILGALDKWTAETAHNAREEGLKPNPSTNQFWGCWASRFKHIGGWFGLIGDASELISCGLLREGFAWRAVEKNMNQVHNLLKTFALSKKEELCGWAFKGKLRLDQQKQNKGVDTTRDHKMTQVQEVGLGDQAAKHQSKEGAAHQAEKVEDIDQAAEDEKMNQLGDAIMSDESNRDAVKFLEPHCRQGGFLDDVDDAAEILARVHVLFQRSKLLKQQKASAATPSSSS